MSAKAIPAQRDFSSGEVDVSAKRADQDQQTATLLKSGCRQLANFRVLNSGAAQNRPGRRAQFVSGQNARVEEVTISPGLVFRLVFSANTIAVRDLNNATVFSQATMPWNAAQVTGIVYAVFQQSVYICSPSGQPQVLSYSGGAWAVTGYVPNFTTGGQRRTVFYRLSALNIAMLPSATTGAAITIIFSSPIPTLSAAVVGSLMRFCGRQILITGFTSKTQLTAQVLESLPPGQVLTVPVDPRPIFNVGDLLVGATSGAKGIVTATSAANVTVQLTSITTNISTGATTPTIDNPSGVGPVLTTGFLAGETIASQGGSDVISASGVANTIPQAVAVWDEEVFNAFRGWPKACFVDQNRLGFCNFPALPNGIAWSAIGSPFDVYPDVNPSSAMFELTPDKTQVYFVVAGPESSEFVFTDKKIYYIPISPTNPLKPGSVAFQILSAMGAAPVQPRALDESLIYIAAGQSTVMAIVALGAYYRPFETRALSRLRSHLIKQPTSIAVPTSQGTFDEQYIYVLNSDGTLAVGRFDVENGQIKGNVAWTPWSGAGTVLWCSARDAVIMFSTLYGNVNIVETLDDTLYLDAAMLVNAAPAGLAPGIGQGPLWFWAGQNVNLMDQGTRSMGVYQVDGAGNIVPQNRGGEDLASATLVAGQQWTGAIEPFVPAVQPGQDALQRMRKRRIARFEIYVANSTGFRVDTLNSDRLGPNLPANGAASTSRRVAAWNQDDNPNLPPPLRERAYAFKPTGRAHDPRAVIIKDTPGPLQVLEISMEVSV